MILVEVNKRRLTIDYHLTTAEGGELKGLVATVRSDLGDTTTIQMPSNYAGRVVPITFQGAVIAAICLLKTDKAPDALELKSQPTLFITQDGQAFTTSNLFTIIDNPPNRLAHTNPHDVRQTVILDSEINRQGKILSYDQTTLCLTSFLAVKFEAIRIHAPVPEQRYLYTTVGEGLEALSSTVEWGYVIEVTYSRQGQRYTEMVLAGTPEHLY